MGQGVTTSRSFPPGATVGDGGVNFSLFSRTATGVELLLFDDEADRAPSRVVRIDPVTNRTYHYWHAFVPGLGAGQLYGYRVEGPSAPERGLRFDPARVLLDPYGRGVVVPKHYDREAARRTGGAAGAAMKNVVVDPGAYDWEGDVPLGRPAARTIIYEMHVRGFTRHPSSGVGEAVRGTYAGLIEKVPYLQELGVTAVELLPVFQFDAQDCPPGRVNYWGYAPVGFFAPHQAYSSRREPLGPVDEFRDMVKALHRAGIEVILDVVFNHTAEGDHTGPTLGFRGIDNPTYYILEEGGSRYANYSGCGNTLNANHPVVRRLIVDSLRYWVSEMHVDGFRFDLASILARDPAGHVLPNPPVLWDIESDPVLAGTKLIAEAWDAAGLYQVGSFVGDTWREWNGRFRDDVRDFFRAAPGSVRRLADRLVGSPELYGHKEREAEQSVNFVTCHDGFTLNDLVSYNCKHNEANGEGNRDGGDDNRSWNCGVEGPTDDPGVERVRNRQVKNFLTVTLVSLGVPMILMGDEVRHTQHGNNNAYCQDNEASWFDWTRVEKHADLHRFLRLLIERRLLRTPQFEQQRVSLRAMLGRATKAWHGVRPGRPDWGDDSHSLALGGELRLEGLRFHLILNAFWEPLDFQLPAPEAGWAWRRWIDTALDSPNDIVPWQTAPVLATDVYRAEARSVVALIASGGGWSMATKPERDRDRHPSRGGVLVSDFDGTMTRHDFYRLAAERLLPPGTPDYWAAYRDGTITHFEALRSYFAAIRAGEDEVLAVVNQMELDPGLAAAVASLRGGGWDVVVTSAGCAWYIRKLLAAAGVDVEVHANPGRFEAGKGLLMEMPTGSPFWSATLGVDKAGVVRGHLGEGRAVGFAGDGFPDAEAARLVPAELRFARGDLAAVLRSDGLPFRSFDTWSDIADALARGGT